MRLVNLHIEQKDVHPRQVLQQNLLDQVCDFGSCTETKPLHTEFWVNLETTNQVFRPEEPCVYQLSIKT